MRDRIDKLAAADPDRHIFGAGIHDYALRPVLSAERLAEIESAAGVKLPSDYVEFITTVGNGGAGPGYGLLPLDGPGQVEGLAGEFPVAHNWQPKPDDPVVEGMGGYDAEIWTAGALGLCDMGEGVIAMLIVNGPEQVRGHVFMECRAMEWGMLDAYPSFTAFYEDWLNNAANPQWTQFPVPPASCSAVNAVFNYVGSVAEQNGTTPEKLDPGVLKTAMLGLPDDAIKIHAPVTSRWFNENDLMRPGHHGHHAFDFYIQQGMLRPESIAQGMPPKPGR
ncbi:MAG: hypothetical protein KDB82_14880 [Planctomycetes bacterium]|nr:hypothetical protein [Planctomycetota bacterium]